MAKKKTAEKRKAQQGRKALQEAHLSPEMKASFKAINIWVAAYYHDKNKEKRGTRKMRTGCASVRANRRKLITLSGMQNHRCCYCGGDTWHPLIEDYKTHRSNSNQATLEHLLPNSQGGTYHWDNLAMACSECNTARGDIPIEEFLASIQVVLKPATEKSKDVKRKDRSLKKSQRLKEMKSHRNRIRLFMVAAWMFPDDYNHIIENTDRRDVKNVFKGGSRRSHTPRSHIMKNIRRRVQTNRMAA